MHNENKVPMSVRAVAKLRNGFKRLNTAYCEACGSSNVFFRVTTRDIKCKKCGHMTPRPSRF